MLKVFDSVLRLGGLLDGYKTLIGASLYLLAELALKFPAFADEYAAILSGAQSVSEVLVALGVIHWKVKDLVRR